MSAATNGDWNEFRYLVMEVCANINQYGRPVALFHSGMPDDYIKNEMAKFFEKIVTIGLYADEDVIRDRLRSRPKWRKSSNPSFIEDVVKYNKSVSEFLPSINTTRRYTRDSACELVAMMKKELNNLR